MSKPAAAQKITLIQTLASFVGGALLKLLARTLRVTHEDRARFYDPARTHPVILCVWHNRLLGAILGDCRTGRRRMPTKVLTSASKDGGWLAAMARRFDLGAVRGSSSRRGAAALLELSRSLAAGHDIVITPDGPRGPNYFIAPGIIQLAAHTKVCIVPYQVIISRFWRIGKKWDALWIPKPFSRLTVKFLEPLEISDAAETFESETARLAEVMGRD